MMERDYTIPAVFLVETYPVLVEERKYLNERVFGNWMNDSRSEEERLADAENLRYIEWKVSVIEHTLRERLNDMERPIFRLSYGKRMNYKEIKEVYKRNTGKKLSNDKIVKAKRNIIACLKMEIQFCDTYEEEREFVHLLFDESVKWSALPGHDKKVKKGIGK